MSSIDYSGIIPAPERQDVEGRAWARANRHAPGVGRLVAAVVYGQPRQALDLIAEASGEELSAILMFVTRQRGPCAVSDRLSRTALCNAIKRRAAQLAGVELAGNGKGERFLLSAEGREALRQAMAGAKEVAL